MQWPVCIFWKLSTAISSTWPVGLCVCVSLHLPAAHAILCQWEALGLSIRNPLIWILVQNTSRKFPIALLLISIFPHLQLLIYTDKVDKTSNYFSWCGAAYIWVSRTRTHTHFFKSTFLVVTVGRLPSDWSPYQFIIWILSKFELVNLRCYQLV